MRRALPLIVLLFAIPLWAADGEQSYISYDEGQSVVRQAYDGRDIEARLNLPIFAGDQIATGRRGRTEVRLADGNIVVVDRESALEITSIANTFEGDDAQSVANLRRGAAIVHLQRDGDPALRLDTSVASYVALSAGIYSVEVGPRGRDQVTVLSGAAEVRTEHRVYRLRAGETARVDLDGISDIQMTTGGESSFDRWYLQRVDRYEGRRARYLDSRYSYVESDLADHGDWVYVGEFGWVWRPYATTGWRPYYHGSWINGPRGHLIWSSYEPWGWYPYHYGRWTHNTIYGWVWLPGYRYSPAWVYWAYGPSWVGWVPSGYYDCYRPYNWIWNGYSVGRTVGVGFFGRVNLVGSDLSGWTILESGTILSTRADRAAMNLDAARARIARDGGRGVFSSNPVRFTRDDIKDPAAAVGRVSRLGLGGGTGKDGSGSSTDLTSFFRRDPELSPAVRSGLERSNMSDAARRITVPTPAPDRATSQTPSAARSLGRAAERSGGPRGVEAGETPAASQPRQGGIARTVPTQRSPAPATGGRVERSTPNDAPRAETPSRGRVISRDSGGEGAVRRAAPAETPRTPQVTPRTPEPAPRTEKSSGDAWRGRVVRQEPAPTPTRDATPTPTREAVPAPAPERQQFDRSDRDWRSRSTYTPREQGRPARSESARPNPTPIPRQVIDRIGGARIVPNRDSGASRGSESRGRIAPPRSSSSPAQARPSRTSPRSSGSSSGPSGGAVRSGTRSAPSRPPAASSAPSRSSGSSGSSKSNMRKD